MHVVVIWWGGRIVILAGVFLDFSKFSPQMRLLRHIVNKIFFSKIDRFEFVT